MRKYLLPMAVCTAIGAIIVVLVKGGDPDPGERPDDTSDQATERVARQPRGGLPPPAETRTALDEHKWLRELERAMQRPGLDRARWYRQKLAEDIDRVLADKKLTNNLVALLEENLFKSTNAEKRDILMPMLRVVRHPDVTEMVRKLYYEAESEEDRMVLVDAMVRPHHDQDEGLVWAVELALNGKDDAMRERAFDAVAQYSNNEEMIIEAASQIYRATTRPGQSVQMVDEVASRVNITKKAQAFVRERFNNPHIDELSVLVGYVEGGWMTEDDAAMLDTLAREFPAMSEMLRERASVVRREIKMRDAGGDEEAIRRIEEEERRKGSGN